MRVLTDTSSGRRNRPCSPATPAVRRGALGAALVILLLANVACAVGAAPTATPTATATHTPSSTPRPTATPTPRPTPTATPVTWTESQADGSTRYTDGEGGFSLVIPPRWLVIELTREDAAAILAASAEQYPDAAPVIEFASDQAAGMRMVAVDLDPSHWRGPESPVLSVAFQPGMGTMPLDLFLDAYTAMVPEILPGATVLGSSQAETAAGVPLGLVDVDLHLEDASGKATTMRMRQVIFGAGENLVNVNIVAPQVTFDNLLPVFEQISDSIEVRVGL